MTAGYCPRHLDEIDELFGFVCRKPISRAVYMNHAEGLGWPEDVVQSEPRGIGDNSQALSESEMIEAQVNDMIESARSWLAEIGGKITTQEQADKSANFAHAFGELEKKADAARKSEKEPHDKAAKAVQTKWAPIIDRAAEKKTWMKKAFETYALAEKRRREDEARRIADEQRRAAEEARAAAEKQAIETGAPVSFSPPVVEPPKPVENVKAGTRGRVSIRTRTEFVISDLPAFAAYAASLETPPPEFMEACRKIANRIGAAGVIAPGVEKTIVEYAA